MTAAAPADAIEAAGPARLAMLRDAAVRDLAWLLFSPDLLRAQPPDAPLATPWEAPEEAEAAAAWLVALDRDAGALHRVLEHAKPTRLGRYAETLLGWFLEHGPGARLIAANVALRRAGRTLGECDFLVETSRGRRLHWELAVKCYLHAGDGRGLLADFVGPNLRDRFDRKLAHLLAHQLRLSGREEFASLGHPGPWLAQMFVKGWLFYRANEASPVDAASLAPDHARGWWVTHADWRRFASAHVQQCRVLSRLEWLAPRRIDAGTTASAPWSATIDAMPPTDPDSLFATLAGRKEPVLVAALAIEGGCYVERSRGFIVPDDWPACARAFARE